MLENNDTPVLRKEELIRILEALFKFSQDPDNALIRKEDGLYVLDFYNLFQEHISDTGMHITNNATAILDNFSLEDDVLLYKNKPIMLTVSNAEGNAVQILESGLYVPDLFDFLESHVSNTNCHLTLEEKEQWGNAYENLVTYVNDTLNALIIYDHQLVDELPIDEEAISPTTIYYLKKYLENGEDRIEYRVRCIYRNHEWKILDLTEQAYSLFARKKYVDDNFVKNDADTVHKHNNLDTLNKFSEENGLLLFDNNNIINVLQISDDTNNALKLGTDNKLFVKDLASELASIANQASLSKTILLEQDCSEAGTYELSEDINNFNFLMVHYYLMPDDPNEHPYDAKMEMLDVDALNELYEKHIDYILEHDYGLSTYNTKIRFLENNKMQVTYYNHVCIYKIIGVR